MVRAREPGANTHMSLQQDGPHDGGCVSAVVWRYCLGGGSGLEEDVGRMRFSRVMGVRIPSPNRQCGQVEPISVRCACVLR